MDLRAINHKLRQKILQFIHDSKRITVTEMYINLHMEQPVTSQHLAILRTEGFVNTQRNGKPISYSVNYERLKQVENVYAKFPMLVQACKDNQIIVRLASASSLRPSYIYDCQTKPNEPYNYSFALSASTIAL